LLDNALDVGQGLGGDGGNELIASGDGASWRALLLADDCHYIARHVSDADYLSGVAGGD
jgi:hypothetical protein